MYKLSTAHGLSEIKKKNSFYVQLVSPLVSLSLGPLNFKCYYPSKGIDTICMFFTFAIEYLFNRIDTMSMKIFYSHIYSAL